MSYWDRSPSVSRCRGVFRWREDGTLDQDFSPKEPHGTEVLGFLFASDIPDEVLEKPATPNSKKCRQKTSEGAA